MRLKFIWGFIVSLVLAGALAVGAAAQGGGSNGGSRDDAFEQALYARLAAISPQAVESFRQATQDMDAGNLEAARQGFEKVLTLAPAFPDAERRLGYVEAGLGQYKEAATHAQNAFTLDPSPINQAALAEVLARAGNQTRAKEALGYAQAAVQALPEDPYANQVLILAGMNAGDSAAVRQGSVKLIALVPDNPLGHYSLGLVLATEKQWEQAEQELRLSQQLGMPAATVQRTLTEGGISSQASLYRWGRIAGLTLAGWLGGLGLLFVVGLLLSQATVAAVRRPVSSAQFSVGWGERLVRQVYRGVIGLTSLYFYLSIPVLILLIVGVAGGLIYLCFAVGQVPMRIVAFVGLAAFYTLFAIVRSLFIRIQEGEPGRPVTRAEAPRLWALAEAVAQRLQTRPVDAIYVTPAAEIAVTERGPLLQKLRGHGQRCLILGLGVLPGMSQGQLESILAHEYGHFSNRDTAGGNLARQVQMSIQLLALGLAQSRQAAWYNPAWWFVNGFNRIFLRITLGASRLQEVLADRYAVVAYGARSFVEGLTHSVRQSLAFDVHVKQVVGVALKQGGSFSLTNLYMVPPSAPGEPQAQLEKKFEEIMARPTSPYDSHPSVRERIELARQIAASSGWEKAEPAWDLLPTAAALQTEMTAVIEKNIRRQIRR